MKDLWDECFDPSMGMSPKVFENTFCKVCRNPTCSHLTQGGAWTRRVATQMERLFTSPKFADPNDPRFADIAKLDFPSAVQEAMRLTISDRRGDWSVPTQADAAALASQMVATLPAEKVLRSVKVTGSKGDVYNVTFVLPPGGQHAAWQCPCKAFEFKKACPHVAYAMTLPPEDAPVPETRTPARFQETDTRERNVGGTAPYLPPGGNIPVPAGGIMVDGTRPPPPRERQAPRAAAPVVDPWAPPPPKPKVIPVGGTVVLGGEKKK